jgi:cell wall-associated NlpC family hydrolase
MEVFQRYGQALPDFTVDAFAFDKIAQLAGGELATRRWEELQRPLDKDAPLVVLMRMHPSLVTHAGVYIGQGRVIHTMESTDAIMSQINRLGSRIVGYYRPC